MTNQEKTEILMLRVIVGILFLSVVFFSFIIHDKSVENEQLITKYKSALFELNAKLESKEAEITGKYNELKKQCKKVKR